MRLGIRQQQHQGESLVPSTETLLPEGTREGRQQSVSLFPSKRELERARRSRNQNNERTARRNSSGRRTHGNRELETRDDGSNELAPTRATSHVPSTKVRKDIHHATLSASTERALSTEREPVEKEIREFTLALDEQQFENPLTVIRATPKEKRKSIFTKVFKRTASGNDQHVGAMEEEVPAPSSAKTNRFSRFLPMFSRKQARALERTTERSQNKGCTMFLVENSSARKYQSERGLETHDDRSRIIAKDSLDRDLNKIGETPSPTRATTAVVSSYKKPDNSEDNAKALFSEIIQNGIAASLQSSKKNRALVSEREPAETKREKNNPTTPNEKVRYPSVVAELEALFAKRKISERDGLQKKSGKNTHSSPLLETKTTREAVKGSKVGKYKRKGKRNRTSRGKMSALELRALISKRSKKLGKNKNDENDKNAETLNQESSLKKDDSAIKLSSSKDEDDSIKILSFGENGTTHKRSAKVGYGLDKEAPPPETTRQAKYPSDADTFSTMSTITARTFFLEKELEAAIGGDRTTPNGVSSRNDSSGGGAFAWFWGNAWFGKEEERQCSALAELQEETVKTSKNLGAVADEFLGDIKTTASFLGTMMANSNYTHDCSCGAVDDSSILAGAESFVTDDPSLDDTRDSNLGGIVSQSSFHTRETFTSTASEEEEEEEGRLTDKYEF